jgi:hypothetical protein
VDGEGRNKFHIPIIHQPATGQLAEKRDFAS